MKPQPLMRRRNPVRKIFDMAFDMGGSPVAETGSERAERLSQMLFNAILEKGGDEELACEAADRLLISLLKGEES